MGDPGLYASQNDLPRRFGQGAMRQFGGITVFGTSEEELNRGIDCVSQAIVVLSAASWGLAPSMLRYLVQQELDAEISKRVFSALLGFRLHLGDLDAVVCEGSKGTPFRIILHRDRLRQFSERTRETCRYLCEHRAIQISQMRDKYFPQSERGSWTQAMYMAARLVRLGIAEYRDRYSIRTPEVVANAILHSNGPFDDPDAGRVASN